MLTASVSAHSHPRWGVNVPIGEVTTTAPLKPNIGRFKYRQPQQQQRSPFHKKPEKDPDKSDDAHKVDDYA